MKIEKLTEIADWILSLPKEEQFKISLQDFIKLSNMLEKYRLRRSNAPDFSDSQFEKYAEFCMECDRKEMKPLKYQDYLKIYC